MWLRSYGWWLCGIAVCLVVGASPALGVEVHRFRLSFGTEGSGAGQFKQPAGVAVNDTTGDVYVVDEGNKRVEKFDSTGTVVLCEGMAPTGGFVDPTEIAVDNSGDPTDPSKEDVYVVDEGKGEIDKFNAACGYEFVSITGTPKQSFEAHEGHDGTIKGLAIDGDGKVWVTVKTGPIFEFSNALVNQPEKETETTAGGGLGGLGIDAEGNIYFGRGGEIVKVNLAGEIIENPVGGDTKAFKIAVDSTRGETYLDSRKAIDAFMADGGAIESDDGPGAISGSFGSFGFSSGVAVNQSNGDVYATDQSPDQVSLFEAILLPTVAIDPVTDRLPRSLTVNGSVNPEGAEVTSCVFEYALAETYDVAKTYDKSIPCSPGSIGAVSTPVAVGAHLEGLSPGKEYDYRLVAENAAKVPSRTPNETFVTGPLIGDEFATDVGSVSVLLHARLDPNGADTTYYLEYGPTESYGSFSPVQPPGVDAGSVEGNQSLGVHLQNLEPGKVYHYRFVAVQDGEIFEGPRPGESEPKDHSFATRSVGDGDVADGRVWELVSPANKKGAVIELSQQGGQIQAAEDGSGIAYATQGPDLGNGAVGKPTYSPVLSRRVGSGWVSANISLPGRLPEDEEVAAAINGFSFEYRLFSPDLSVALVEPQTAGTPPLAPGVNERTLYLRDNRSGSATFMPLVWPGDVPPGTVIEERNFSTSAAEWEMMFLAGTPDLQHLVLKSPMAFTEDAIDEEHVSKYVSGAVQWNLYEWSNDTLALVNVLPNGTVAHGPYPLVPPVRLASVTSVGGRARGGAQRVMSDDGRRVAWTWGEPYTPQRLEAYRGLYVRDMVEGRTARVGGAHALYQTMNSDGSKVFYLEDGKLFVYKFDTAATTDLTSVAGAGVLESVSDVSQDGSYVYFVATGVLAEGGKEGEDNLYVLHDTGEDWTTAFIGTLSQADKPSWHGTNFEAPFLARTSSRVSSDGRYLVFMSNRSLTGYDNLDAVSGIRDEEVFRYDAVGGLLDCVSCDPSGARPAGVFDTDASELLVDRFGVWTAKESTGVDPHSDHWLGGNVPGWDDLSRDPATYQPRYLSDSGRVFFDSSTGLVPKDSNGLEDVYEWEPVGVGACGAAGGNGLVRSGDGCVGLVSSGTAGDESAFYDASTTGDDVFFTTTGRLVGEDFDKGYDLYDAHVCTVSVPCATGQPPRQACSSSDSCKGTPSPQPEIFGPAPSATFAGEGNVALSKVVGKGKNVSRSQKLKRALRACLNRRSVRRRGACMRQARRRYGAASARTRAQSTAKAGRRGR